MMKYSLIAAMVAASLGLAGCGQPEQANAQEDEQSKAQTSKTAAQNDGKPELGSFGVDLSARDESVDPGDDFFRYANGTWLDNTTILEDRSNYGMFTALAIEAEQQ